MACVCAGAGHLGLLARDHSRRRERRQFTTRQAAVSNYSGREGEILDHPEVVQQRLASDSHQKSMGRIFHNSSGGATVRTGGRPCHQGGIGIRMRCAYTAMVIDLL
jgi:hypothetical protein